MVRAAFYLALLALGACSALLNFDEGDTSSSDASHDARVDASTDAPADSAVEDAPTDSVTEDAPNDAPADSETPSDATSDAAVCGGCGPETRCDGASVTDGIVTMEVVEADPMMLIDVAIRATPCAMPGDSMTTNEVDVVMRADSGWSYTTSGQLVESAGCYHVELLSSPGSSDAVLRDCNVRVLDGSTSKLESI